MATQLSLFQNEQPDWLTYLETTSWRVRPTGFTPRITDIKTHAGWS